MRSVQSWLDEYSESHQNRINKTIHWVCVPLILLSIIGLLWSIPVPGHLAARSLLLNWGVVFLIATLLYYFMLSWRLALGMTLVALLAIVIIFSASHLPVSLWRLSLAVFVAAWVGQFIGHKIEGRKPSFFKDLQFLLIGPLWLLAAVYRQLHMAIARY
ncbi:MAG: DUF962 domain-containing protein [Gammaproteobacteria bacterium]|nr:DUF962 domain-containing protein [Gammaproteobacteria bacterium]MDE2346354.1 DUF962 domain-containing protein [Gammaproteobacteria bacterium]